MTASTLSAGELRFPLSGQTGPFIMRDLEADYYLLVGWGDVEGVTHGGGS